MTKTVSPWLDDTIQTPDWPTVTPEELFAVWNVNRNSSVGSLAAEEVMRRIMRGDLVLTEKTGKHIHLPG